MVINGLGLVVDTRLTLQQVVRRGEQCPSKIIATNEPYPGARRFRPLYEQRW